MILGIENYFRIVFGVNDCREGTYRLDAQAALVLLVGVLVEGGGQSPAAPWAEPSEGKR
jgi:hypothetical protein